MPETLTQGRPVRQDRRQVGPEIVGGQQRPHSGRRIGEGVAETQGNTQVRHYRLRRPAVVGASRCTATRARASLPLRFSGVCRK